MVKSGSKSLKKGSNVVSNRATQEPGLRTHGALAIRPRLQSLKVMAIASWRSGGNGLGELWHAVKARFVRAYRPERHYMRGPGPKCREKARAGEPRKEAGQTPAAKASPSRHRPC
jgi:hypothetical protein